MDNRNPYSRSNRRPPSRRPANEGGQQRPQRRGQEEYSRNRAQKRKSEKLAAALIIVILIAVIGFVAWWVSGNGGLGATFEKGIDSSLDGVDGTKAKSLDKKDNRNVPVKLLGSDEEMDENGVVHGTTPGGISYVLYGRGEKSNDKKTITLCAVGDNMGTDSNLPVADRFDGGTGDGAYDFKPFYTELKPVVSKYDLAFINQETMTAGTDNGRSYTGYPEFNTPDSVVDAIVDAGFNIVNMGSNHTWDQGEDGVLRTQGVIDSFPGVMRLGSYESAADRSAVRLQERNKKTVAFLSYTYGDNHYATIDEFPNTYYSCPFDKDAMQAEIKRAQAVADAVVVYVHWGTEYTSVPNDQQRDYAQFLADQGVDLVIGSHAHIIQPVEMYTSSTGKQVPVVFGLGNLTSGWDTAEYLLSGLFSCSISWDDEGNTQIGDMKWSSLVEWSDGTDQYVRFLKDMDAKTADQNRLTSSVANDKSYFEKKLSEVKFDCETE
ncbi:MAG: CapA family protein [Coriobacteriales bacterium]|jgi:hypothetical protein